MPLALEVAEIYPRTPVVFLSGRKAVYVTPAGLLVVMGASPSFPVTPGTGTGAWALTRARPERAARVMAECISNDA